MQRKSQAVDAVIVKTFRSIVADTGPGVRPFEILQLVYNCSIRKDDFPSMDGG